VVYAVFVAPPSKVLYVYPKLPFADVRGVIWYAADPNALKRVVRWRPNWTVLAGLRGFCRLMLIRPWLKLGRLFVS
jgi:hypothetical protein